MPSISGVYKLAVALFVKITNLFSFPSLMNVTALKWSTGSLKGAAISGGYVTVAESLPSTTVGAVKFLSLSECAAKSCTVYPFIVLFVFSVFSFLYFS